MLSIKKKLFGYDQAEVDYTIKELNDEIFSLRQELFSTEKKPEPAAAGLNGNERAELLTAIEQLSVQIKQKDTEIAELKLQYKQSEAAPARPVDRSEISAYQNALAVKDSEISELRAYIAKQQVQYEQSTAQRSSSPNMKMIEAVYMRAFDGAKDIASDARNSVSDLVDRMYFEIESDISTSARMHKDLISAKRNISMFIAQGMEHFKALEKMLGSIPEKDLRTSEYLDELQKGRSKILSDVDRSLVAFESDMNENFALSDEPPAAREIAAPPPPSAPVYIPEPSPMPTPEIKKELKTEPVLAEKPAGISVAERFIQSVAEAPVVQAEVQPRAVAQEEISGNTEMSAIFAQNEAEEDVYDPGAELQSMKEAIRREYQQSSAAKTDEITVEAEEADNTAEPVAPATANNRPKKVNIQDILKKYSNLDA